MSPLDAFEHLLVLSAVNGNTAGFSNMQANKLVYITHGYTLASVDTPLIQNTPIEENENNNDRIEAWEHGPVIRSLYFNLRQFGSNKVSIKEYQENIINNAINRNFNLAEKFHNSIKSVIESGSKPKRTAFFLLDWVNKTYGSKSAKDLRRITHKPNTPWYQCRNSAAEMDKLHIHIPDDLIKEHYQKLVSKR